MAGSAEEAGLRGGASEGDAERPVVPQGRPPYGFVAPAHGVTPHRGYAVPSETYRWGDQGTEWPLDAFSALVVSSQAAPLSRPMPHSYASDDNMESYRIAGPYAADSEASSDLGLFTGATGPSGHVTPEAHPELTAPLLSSNPGDGIVPATAQV